MESKKANLDNEVNSTESLLSKSCIGSLANSRGGSTVGLSILNFETATCIFYQFSDTASFPRTLQIIASFKLEQVLIPKKNNQSYSVIYEVLKSEFPKIELIPINRDSFSEPGGISFIKRYGIEEDLKTISLIPSPDLFYGFSCVGSLFSYFEFIEKIIFPQNSINFKNHRISGYMLLDSNTIENLELIENKSNSKSKSKETLLGVMNYTSTPMGLRLLHTNICQPISDEPTLKERLECIDELRTMEDKVKLLREILPQIPDIGKIISSIVIPKKTVSMKIFEQKIRIIIDLKRLINEIKNVSEILQGLKSQLFLAINKILTTEKIKNIKEVIESKVMEDLENINSNTNLKNIKCFVIKVVHKLIKNLFLKEGLNGLLDVARKAYSEAIEDAIALIEKYKETYNLPFKLVKSSFYGFSINLNSEHLEDIELPDIFNGQKRNSKILTLKTLDLEKSNERIKNALEEVYLLSNIFCQEIIAEISSHLGLIHKLSEAFSILDLITSLTYLSVKNNYTKPEFSNYLIIKGGRHPIMDLYSKKFIPNDIYSDYLKKLFFVMGPNMSGKTTYIKMVGLLLIMAHVGSYIPADFASICITDTILSRFSSTERNQESSFYKELVGTSQILNNMHGKSILLFDELGRGTSPIDGLAISYAICEYLLQSKAKVFFSSHFQELPIYMKIYPGVTVISMKVEECSKNGKSILSFTHNAQEGYSYIKNYGIKLATQINMPEEIIREAQKISEKIMDITQSNIEDIDMRIERQQRKSFSTIGQALCIASQDSELNPKEKAQIINSLKSKFYNDLKLLLDYEEF